MNWQRKERYNVLNKLRNQEIYVHQNPRRLVLYLLPTLLIWLGTLSSSLLETCIFLARNPLISTPNCATPVSCCFVYPNTTRYKKTPREHLLRKIQRQ